MGVGPPEPETVQQWHMRQWLKADPNEFMARKPNWSGA